MEILFEHIFFGVALWLWFQELEKQIEDMKKSQLKACRRNSEKLCSCLSKTVKSDEIATRVLEKLDRLFHETKQWSW